MSKPLVHAKSTARKYGGQPSDYLEIHQLMDLTKSSVADNRHRLLTHNSFFVGVMIEKIFGLTITNSEGREVSTRDIAEMHVLEDFGGYIPSLQDWIEELPMADWMSARGVPPSARKIAEARAARPRLVWKGD